MQLKLNIFASKIGWYERLKQDTNIHQQVTKVSAQSVWMFTSINF